jgi:hypothetical protein
VVDHHHGGAGCGDGLEHSGVHAGEIVGNVGIRTENDLGLNVLGGDQWDPDETGAEASVGHTMVEDRQGSAVPH